MNSFSKSVPTRYLHSFLLSATLYFALFALLFLFSQTKEELSPKTESINTIAIHLKSYPIAKQPIKTTKKVPPVQKQNVSEIKKEKVIQKKIPKLKNTHSTQKEVVKKESIKNTQALVHKVNQQETLKTPKIEVSSKKFLKTQKNLQEQQIAFEKQQTLVLQQQKELKQNLFIEQLREEINKNKSYPNTARRRGVEGFIEMHFVLYANGTVGNISYIDGKTLFQRSAQEAIEKSFPLKVENNLFVFPKEFKIKLLYKLI